MRFILLALSMTLTSCTLYSSAGRKDFEKKSPSYVRTQAFVGCEPLTQEQQSPEFMESYLARTFYRDDQFLVASEPHLAYWIQVLKPTRQDICHYNFASLEEWLEVKAYFLEHLE